MMLQTSSTMHAHTDVSFYFFFCRFHCLHIFAIVLDLFVIILVVHLTNICIQFFSSEAVNQSTVRLSDVSDYSAWTVVRCVTVVMISLICSPVAFTNEVCNTSNTFVAGIYFSS